MESLLPLAGDIGAGLVVVLFALLARWLVKRMEFILGNHQANIDGAAERAVDRYRKRVQSAAKSDPGVPFGDVPSTPSESPLDEALRLEKRLHG